MVPEVLVFSHSSSSRLQYIIDLLTQYYGATFRLVFDEHRYTTSNVPVKINYGYHRISDDEIFIHSHVLLFESSIRPVKIDCFQHNHYKAFFKAEGHVGFDLFAAIFYLISRYEEYLPYQKDNYGRFSHENAVAYKEGFLDQPLVNIWLEDFRKLLAARLTWFSDTGRKFKFLPTYDIDMAWSFRHKGFKRNAGAILLLILRLRFGQAIQRIKIIRNKKEDPYDSYAWMNELHSGKNLKPIYFFLVARNNGRYDKNIDPSGTAMKKLIRDVSMQYKVGLHPSWQSFENPSLISKEKGILENITEKKVDDSRQHFIRFQMPETFQLLISNGIISDYSMGYGTVNGFRASIATPFYWYDIKEDKATQLMIHPFCYMDANSYYEQGMDPDEAYKELMHYYEVIRSVNGTLITIWHNSFLGTAPEFEGWREMYKKFISHFKK